MSSLAMLEDMLSVMRDDVAAMVETARASGEDLHVRAFMEVLESIEHELQIVDDMKALG